MKPTNDGMAIYAEFKDHDAAIDKLEGQPCVCDCCGQDLRAIGRGNYSVYCHKPGCEDHLVSAVYPHKHPDAPETKALREAVQKLLAEVVNDKCGEYFKSTNPHISELIANVRAALSASAPAAPPIAAEYHRGAKEAFQRVADEWPQSRDKAQTWANNCAVSEQQHRAAADTKDGE